MVQLRSIGPADINNPHYLMANEHIPGFEMGYPKECLIMKMTDGRFAVMASTYLWSFYMVFNESDLHQKFNEQTSILNAQTGN